MNCATKAPAATAIASAAVVGGAASASTTDGARVQARPPSTRLSAQARRRLPREGLPRKDGARATDRPARWLRVAADRPMLART
jgi:hypothetical protein